MHPNRACFQGVYIVNGTSEWMRETPESWLLAGLRSPHDLSVAQIVLIHLVWTYRGIPPRIRALVQRQLGKGVVSTAMKGLIVAAGKGGILDDGSGGRTSPSAEDQGLKGRHHTATHAHLPRKNT